MNLQKEVSSEITKLDTRFGVIGDTYFYIKPTSHVLCGFSCSISPKMTCSFSKFFFPLYDRRSAVSSVYSTRLPHPYSTLQVYGVSAFRIAQEFIDRTEIYREEVCEVGELSKFVEYLGNRDLRNPWSRRGYALSLIMVGKMESAAEQIKELQKDQASASWPGFKEDITEVSLALSKGEIEARALLTFWERQTKVHLHINAGS